MKDWEKLQADQDLILGTHYTKGRAGQHINKIVLHHNAGNLSIQGCYNTWQTRPASAHYQVEQSGRIGQLVWDKDTAWHAGNAAANRASIGIEHANATFDPTWTISEATLDNGAHLVAALCHYYKLGRPSWGVNVFPHSYFTATGCPGAINGSQRTAYMARASAWYDRMNGHTTPASTVTNQVTTTPPPAAKPTGLVVDGYWGADTTRALQQLLGTPRDGVVSSQSQYWKKQNPGLTTGWQWVTNPEGSQLIIRLQQTLGVEADGLIGPATIKALQRRMGTPVDGIISEQSRCVTALQEHLNEGKGI